MLVATCPSNTVPNTVSFALFVMHVSQIFRPTSVHSPLNARKSKKPAPPPPISPHRDSPARPEATPTRPEATPTRPETTPTLGRPDTHSSVSRTESVKKPSIPPPGPPKNHRPHNPPPPCPAPAVPKSSPSPSSDMESSPFLAYASTDLIDLGARAELERSKSDSSDSQPVTPVTNSSGDDYKGHARAKSHDWRQRAPPPIPKRTHSIPSRQSPHQSANKDKTDEPTVQSEGSMTPIMPVDSLISLESSEDGDAMNRAQAKVRDRTNSSTGDTQM